MSEDKLSKGIVKSKPIDTIARPRREHQIRTRSIHTVSCNDHIRPGSQHIRNSRIVHRRVRDPINPENRADRDPRIQIRRA